MSTKPFSPTLNALAIHSSRASASYPESLSHACLNELSVSYLSRPLQPSPFLSRCPTSLGCPKEKKWAWPFLLTLSPLLDSTSRHMVIALNFLLFYHPKGEVHLFCLLLTSQYFVLGLINMWVQLFGLTHINLRIYLHYSKNWFTIYLRYLQILFICDTIFVVWGHGSHKPNLFRMQDRGI